MHSRLLSPLAQMTVIAAVYFGAAKLGLSMAFAAEQVTAVWPPTGIALAATLLLGYRVWPGIALGAFLANITTPNETIPTACGIAVGNTLEALAGAWLLHRIEFRPSLRRLKDVLGLLVLAAGLSTAVSATIGVTSLCLRGVQPWSAYASLWWVWWLGDAVGDLVVAPVLLTWGVWLRSGSGLRRPVETAILLAGLAAVSTAIFTSDAKVPTTDPLAYIIFPFVIWAALRQGAPATTSASLLASIVAVAGTVDGFGPFGEAAPQERLMALQIFMAVLTVSALVVMATTDERDTAEQHRAAGYAVAQTLAESTSLQDAISGVLPAICNSLRWDLGAFWDLDRQANVLRCTAVWRNPATTLYEFEALTRRTTFTPGIGLPGRVWAARRPVWIADVPSDLNFPRAPVAAREGLHGAFGFPVVLGNEVLGVVEFFSRQVRPRDDELLRMMAAVGSQLGLFIERKRAEEALRDSEQRLRLALDAGKIGAWDWDIAADRVTWSERIYEFHGLPPGTFGGKVADFTALIHPEELPGVTAAIRRAIEQGSPYEIEFRIVRPSGEVRWIATSGRVLYDPAGKPVRMLGATLDTTQRKQAEEALREADRRKDEFLAMLGHELRNPLAPIQNALHILRLGAADAAQRRWAEEIMQRQVSHLARLVDDLLDVSRITRGKVQLRKERVDLVVAVQRAIEAVRPAIDSQRHQLTIELPSAPVGVQVDPVRLEQVLTNLLQNAAKYTEAGGQIRVTCEQEANAAVVRVRDTGMGIAPDLLPRVFDLFAQADRALDRSQGGLGIGLTLARRLVDLHGGCITAHSDGPGKGSEFIVRLPLAEIRDQGIGIRDQESGGSEADGQTPRSSLTPDAYLTTPGRRVLAVDDNVDAAESLGSLLRFWGHEVRLAHDGPTALKIADAFRPEIVLLDIGLPGMNGYELAERLRREVRLTDALLVALTGYGQEEDHRRSFERGFDHHLVKPVNTLALRQLLATSSASSLATP